MYQNLYDRVKNVTDKDACMRFYDVSWHLYLETGASGVSLVARVLQVMDGINCRHDEVPDNATLQPIAFASKSLLHAEQHYSNTE